MKKNTPREYLVKAPYCLLKICQIIYLLGVKIRYWLYARGILKTYESSKEIISIGNLSVGGTGKTPFTIWLANNYIKENFLPCIVLRGYKAKQKITSPVLVNRNIHTAEDIGDEALLIAQRTEAQVIVCPDRVQAVKYIESNLPDINIILLDDAYQNLKVKKNKNICLIDCSDSLGDSVLPVGSLREEFRHIERADSIILTRAYISSGKVSELKEKIKEYNIHAEIVELQETLSNIKTLDNNRDISLESLNNKTGIAFCGLGNPQQFFELLKQNNQLNITEYKSFPDHHSYSSQDIEELVSLECDYLLTTAKDAVKLQKYIGKNIYYIEYGITGLA